uniref:Uncharacterized protein n=1 Tax=Megaselia scalaris TaxID=36166 RepID=T1GKN4_MEGSC
ISNFDLNIKSIENLNISYNGIKKLICPPKNVTTALKNIWLEGNKFNDENFKISKKCIQGKVRDGLDNDSYKSSDYDSLWFKGFEFIIGY